MPWSSCQGKNQHNVVTSHCDFIKHFVYRWSISCPLRDELTKTDGAKLLHVCVCVCTHMTVHEGKVILVDVVHFLPPNPSIVVCVCVLCM